MFMRGACLSLLLSAAMAASSETLRGGFAAVDAESVASQIEAYPSLVEVATRVAAGSPATQILQLVSSIKNGLDAEQAADISKQAGIRKSCAKQMADMKTAVSQVETEISSFEAQKASAVVDSGVTAKELAQHDEAARRARQMYESVKAQRDEMEGKVAAIKRELTFQNEKHKPHMGRLQHMVKVVGQMKTEIANAVRDVADEAPKNGTVDAAALAAGIPADKVMKAVAQQDKGPKYKDFPTTHEVSKGAASLLEEAAARAAAGAGAQQRVDMSAGMALRQLAMDLQSGPDGIEGGARAADWVGLVQEKLDALEGSFQGQILRAVTMYNASQLANDAKMEAYKADVEKMDAKLTKLTTFLKTTAHNGVRNAKAKIERLGTQLADTKTQLDRSTHRLADAKTAYKEAEETCKTYESEFKERRRAASEEMTLLNQLEGMITAKLASIKSILAKAVGALAKKNAENAAGKP